LEVVAAVAVGVVVVVAATVVGEPALDCEEPDGDVPVVAAEVPVEPDVPVDGVGDEEPPPEWW
jgi:hypothetical protein